MEALVVSFYISTKVSKIRYSGIVIINKYPNEKAVST